MSELPPQVTPSPLAGLAGAALELVGRAGDHRRQHPLANAEVVELHLLKLVAELSTLLNGEGHEYLAPALEAGRG